MSNPTESDSSHARRTALLSRVLRIPLILGIGLIAVLVLLSMGSAPARADTPVSGLITSDTTWTAAMSPIWVEGDIFVTNAATLTIDPGVEVRFDGFFDITVSDGALIAVGDAGGAGVITFTSNYTVPFAGAWEGLIFDGGGSSVLDDVVIRYAQTSVRLNGASVPMTDVQILDSSWYGVWVSASVVTTYDLSFTGCTISRVGFYGIYFDTQFDTNVNLLVSGCTFSSYGTAALRFGTLQWADFDLTIESSSFNASNRAVYFSSSMFANVDEGNAFRFTFRDNWLNSSLDSYGLYMASLYDFREASVVLDGNTFIGQSSRSYAVLLNDFWGAVNDAQNLTLQVTGNTFRDLAFAGVYFDQVIDYRNVSFLFTDNLFENTAGVYMDYGVYTFWSPYYNQDGWDNTYTLAIERNTVIDLDVAGVYIAVGTADGFRNVDVSIDGNLFDNTRTFTTLDYGVYLPAFRFDDPSLASRWDLSVDGNVARDLNTYAIYFTSTISGFRTVGMSITGNTFENRDLAWMDRGVYFSSSPSYTTAYPGVFALDAGANRFWNLTSYSLYFSSITSFSQVVVDVHDNDFSGSSYGFYLSNGVDGAENLTFAFTDNTATSIGSWALWASGFQGISLMESQASFDVSGNTIADAPNGLYLGDIADYNLGNSILIEDNVLTDILGNAIQLGWHTHTSSRVTIRSNVITGPSANAIFLNGFQDQSALVTLSSNAITGAVRGIAINYVAYNSGDTTLDLVNNDIQQITEYGIYVYEVYRAAAFISIRDNVVNAAQESFFSASLIYFDDGGSGWYRALADITLSGNVLDRGLHGLYVYGTYGYGATVLLDITQMTAVDTAFGITLDFPVGHPADIMNVRIQDSTFQNNQRGFLFLNQAGLGLLPIEIQNVEVTGFGAWGGYAFFMGANVGGIVQLDVWNSNFQAATGALGDVYAGFGPVTMNFWYIDSITKGVANSPGQIIRTVWTVDVQVLTGRNLDTPVPAGIVVYARDQFGQQSFIAVTDSEGMVRGQMVSGVIIAYANGSAYAGPAIQTLVAKWGPFNGTIAATFAGNSTTQIFLIADNDGDGLHDAVDPDDDNDGIADSLDANPWSAGFLDYQAPPYSMHLWVLLGLIGAIALTIVFKLWRGQSLQIRRPPEPPPRGAARESTYDESPLDQPPPPIAP